MVHKLLVFDEIVRFSAHLTYDSLKPHSWKRIIHFGFFIDVENFDFFFFNFIVKEKTWGEIFSLSLLSVFDGNWTRKNRLTTVEVFFGLLSWWLFTCGVSFRPAFWKKIRLAFRIKKKIPYSSWWYLSVGHETFLFIYVCHYQLLVVLGTKNWSDSLHLDYEEYKLN